MAHQVMIKNIAKTEFILGVVSMISDTIGITEFQHVQEKIAKGHHAARIVEIDGASERGRRPGESVGHHDSGF